MNSRSPSPVPDSSILEDYSESDNGEHDEVSFASRHFAGLSIGSPSALSGLLDVEPPPAPWGNDIRNMAKMTRAEALAYLKKIADYFDSDPQVKQSENNGTSTSNIPSQAPREESPEVQEVPRPDDFTDKPRTKNPPSYRPLPKWRRDNEKKKNVTTGGSTSGSSPGN